MLFTPEDRQLRLARLFDGASEADVPRLARQALEIDPNFAPAWTVLGSRAEDPEEAQAALWKALWLAPCKPENYLALGDALTAREESDPLAKRLRGLALWKLSFEDEVPDYIVEHFEKALGAEAGEPETYERLAMAQDAEFEKVPEPAAVTARLRPYRLLNLLQIEAPDGLDDDTLKQILASQDECEPLLRNALREWGRTGNALDDKTLRLLIAILGEISGPDATDELIELSTWGDHVTFLHVHWALHRLAERYPKAALESFRAAAEGAAVPRRCAIAEQLCLMDPLPGDVELLESLVNGLESLKSSEDTPYLLGGVVHGLMLRNQRERAKKIGKLQSMLSGAAREVVRDALRGLFTSLLEDEDIAGVDLNDVCIERLLMDDEDDEDEDEDEDEDGDEDDEDEDDEFDEEELEDEVDLAPPPRPGRNDPCWCGSGKKYKKCHLAADEGAELTDAQEAEGSENPGEEMPVQAALMARVLDASRAWHKESDIRRAKKMYFDESGEVEADEGQIDAFIQWLLHDFRDPATRQTPIEHFLRTRGANLTQAERERLESLRDARFGLYEVERVVPGSGIDVHDVFGGDRMFVHDVSSSKSMHRWDCLLTRTQFYEGRWIFAGNGTLVPRNLLDPLRDIVERESRAARQSPAQFMLANSHRIHREVYELFERGLDNIRVVNNEGEEVSFGKADYETTDEAAVLAKLRSLEELEEGEADASGNPRFTWIQPMGNERRPMGNLEIGSGRLLLEAMSRTRLETLRGLVEFHAGALIRHRGDQYTSVDEIKDRIRHREPEPEAPLPIPSPVERQVIEQMQREHYARWPDESIPALGGKTPRRAVRTTAGRQAVIDLLRLMENGEERNPSGPAYDFNIIRRELGLPEE